MDIFDVLTLIGGLCLFLFGMNLMGQALERRAGGALRRILGKLTGSKLLGFLTGLGVTAIIQSSSATTVMVVGFVNSGIMELGQAINVIMGANVGTTVTAWLLSLSGIDSSNVFVRLLKPSSFTPVLALVGIIYYMFLRDSKKKDTGVILLGFATLMFGMDTMTGAVSGLKTVPAFQELFIAFQNPVLGMLAGAVLTAIIQSSSASVGILQALAITGQVSYGAAIPIIMGQNIGTCITALLSSVGTNKNARRAALVHLSFNVIGTAVWLGLFCVIKGLLHPALLDQSASLFGIAVAHSIFNILCTALLLPLSKQLEKLAYVLIPENAQPDTNLELDERLFATPALALQQCRGVALDMGEIAAQSLRDALDCLKGYDKDLAAKVREAEDKTDRLEDLLGSYLVKLSALQLGDGDSDEAAMLLKVIGDFERIGDHSVNLLESAEELHEKELVFSDAAKAEITVLIAAVMEILDLALSAFRSGDIAAIASIEPLEQRIDDLKDQLRSNHILRLQQGGCTIAAGFIWSDLLTNLERCADHCSNIGMGLLDFVRRDLNSHEHQRDFRRESPDFREKLVAYTRKYALM